MIMDVCFNDPAVYFFETPSWRSFSASRVIMTGPKGGVSRSRWEFRSPAKPLENLCPEPVGQVIGDSVHYRSQPGAAKRRGSWAYLRHGRYTAKVAGFCYAQERMPGS
jgi:hypothetical protein